MEEVHDQASDRVNFVRYHLSTFTRRAANSVLLGRLDRRYRANECRPTNTIDADLWQNNSTAEARDTDTARGSNLGGRKVFERRYRWHKEDEVADPAMKLRVNIEHKDSRQRRRKLCSVAITDDLRGVGFVDGNDQVWRLERTKEIGWNTGWNREIDEAERRRWQDWGRNVRRW